MRHTHADLRRLARRKLDALGARRQRLLNQRTAVEASLEKVERLTQPVMALLAEIDAQEPSPPVPAATPPAPKLRVENVGSLTTRPRVEGLWRQ